MPASPRPSAFTRIALSAVGGTIAIALMIASAEWSHYPLFMVPFATSIVLVLGTPEAEPAQPRALIGGHLIASLMGLLVLNLVGPSEWAAAVSVGLAMGAMHLTRTFHPPAGINPLLAVLNNVSWTFILMPVAIGVVTLALFTFAWHKIWRHRAWPA